MYSEYLLVSIIQGEEMNALVRRSAVDSVKSMFEDNIIFSLDFKEYEGNKAEVYNPEVVRKEFETWYITLGIENVTGKLFNLKSPYFTEEEIKQLNENDEMLLCVPKGVSRKELGQLFHLNSWANEDDLVSNTIEVEDFWFKVKISQKPEHLDKGGKEIKSLYEKDRKLGMSLERYMVMVARMRYLFGETPDTKTKTWIQNNKYEKSAMLIAGFDSNKNFSVQAWMPNFHTPIVGGRSVEIVDHLYL